VPEFEKTMQLGKFGKQVIALPDKRLQQGTMIRQTIENMRGGQAIALQLMSEVLGNHRSLRFPCGNVARPRPYIASLKSKLNVYYQGISSR
jgi:hypothetical protein